MYWLCGPEEYLRDQALRKLRAQILDPGFAEFNHQVLKVSAATRLSVLLDALAELPMMTDCRLLELQNVHELPAKLGDELAAALTRQSYPGLVIVFAGETPKTKSSLWEELKKSATVLTCDIDPKARGEFVALCCAQCKLELDGKQQATVAERCAGNLRLIQQAVERIHLFAGDKRRVSDAELDTLVHDSAETQAWKLTAAIGARKQQEAYHILHRMLQQDGSQAPGLLSYLNSYLLGLVQVAELKPRLKTAAAIAKELPRKQEFQIRKTLEELATWNETELATAFERLARADHRIKTGSDPTLMLQLLILQLCSRRGQQG
jgi:DNA polymerase III delta subunit